MNEGRLQICFDMQETQNPALDTLRSFIGKAAFKTPSPYGTWLAGKLLSAEAGQLEAEYVVRSEMLNPIGTLHGGVTAGIFDDLLGATMFSLGFPEFMSSINLSVDFLAPARPGDTVRVTTQVTKAGRQLLHAHAHMYDAKGKLLATATTNLLRTEIQTRPS